MFASNRGFRGRAIEWCQTNSTATNPCCHSNEIWDIIGHNSAYIRDIREIFVYNGGFQGWAIEWRQTNSTATNPYCHGNEICDKIGYNSVYIRDISEIFVYNMGFFEVGLLNDARQTNHCCHGNEIWEFVTKSAITRPIHRDRKKTAPLNKML